MTLLQFFPIHRLHQWNLKEDFYEYVGELLSQFNSCQNPMKYSEVAFGKKIGDVGYKVSQWVLKLKTFTGELTPHMAVFSYSVLSFLDTKEWIIN